MPPKIASTNYDEHPDSSSRELFVEAAIDAFGETDPGPSDLGAVYVGNFMGALIEDQGHVGALLADHVGARGSAPVNTSGGPPGKGHPVGVTGIGRIVELTKRIDGRHPNQVRGLNTALTHNVGGNGASTTVTVIGGE